MPLAARRAIGARGTRGSARGRRIARRACPAAAASAVAGRGVRAAARTALVRRGVAGVRGVEKGRAPGAGRGAGAAVVGVARRHATSVAEDVCRTADEAGVAPWAVLSPFRPGRRRSVEGDVRGPVIALCLGGGKVA